MLWVPDDKYYPLCNPLPTGCQVLLEGRRIKQRRNMVVLEGKVIRADNQELVADCQASFMLAD